jgi:hypothetical protein
MDGMLDPRVKTIIKNNQQTIKILTGMRNYNILDVKKFEDKVLSFDRYGQTLTHLVLPILPPPGLRWFFGRITNWQESTRVSRPAPPKISIM